MTTAPRCSFTLVRTYDAEPARVFRAWSDPAAKAIWFGADGEGADGTHELDFRVGGHEVNRGEFEGAAYRYEAVYHDIVETERIVYAYDMYKDDARISVSLGSVELEPAGDGTKLTYTEDGAFFDDADTTEQRQAAPSSSSTPSATRSTRPPVRSLDLEVLVRAGHAPAHLERVVVA